LTEPHRDAAADHAPGLDRAFGAPIGEADYAVQRIDGELPPGLRGTYYVNGPARFRRGDRVYGHWLDGDGMVGALRLDGDGAHWTQRYVRSHKLVAEEAAGEALFRAFGTRFAGDRLLHGLALASPVNVSVYPYGDTLLAFGEQGLPWELDPRTLETRGEYTFAGKLKRISPFSAHPNFDFATGELFNFGVSFSAEQPCLNLYRFAAGGTAVYRVREPLPWPCSIHDFGLTARFAVFHISPYLLDMAAFTGGERSLMECLEWRPELGTSVWLFDRQDGRLRHRVPIGNAYCLHLAHCHEVGDLLHVDVIEMDEPVYDQYEVPELFPDVRLATIRRHTLDTATGVRAERRELGSDLMCDFPAIDPRAGLGPYHEFWSLGIGATHAPGRKFFDQVLRYDWRQGGAVDTYQAPDGCYLGGEPVFLPDPQTAGAGFTLCQLFDAERRASSLLLFDAHDLAAGPRATLHLEEQLHLGFHASWRAADP
jgi:all-trans-8'-apo-beta-carotenal 15,15'-oxygenase